MSPPPIDCLPTAELSGRYAAASGVIPGFGNQNVTALKTGKAIASKDSYLAALLRLAAGAHRQHGKIYLEHPPAETRHIIDAISWPEA
jgi:hypothetical protein